MGGETRVWICEEEMELVPGGILWFITCRGWKEESVSIAQGLRTDDLWKVATPLLDFSITRRQDLKFGTYQGGGS